MNKKSKCLKKRLGITLVVLFCVYLLGFALYVYKINSFDNFEVNSAFKNQKNKKVLVVVIADDISQLGEVIEYLRESSTQFDLIAGSFNKNFQISDIKAWAYNKDIAISQRKLETLGKDVSDKTERSEFTALQRSGSESLEEDFSGKLQGLFFGPISESAYRHASYVDACLMINDYDYIAVVTSTYYMPRLKLMFKIVVQDFTDINFYTFKSSNAGIFNNRGSVMFHVKHYSDYLYIQLNLLLHKYFEFVGFGRDKSKSFGNT